MKKIIVDSQEGVNAVKEFDERLILFSTELKARPSSTHFKELELVVRNCATKAELVDFQHQLAEVQGVIAKMKT